MDLETSLEPLDGGWSGETFLAEAGGERTVVRIFADPRHSPDAADIQASLLRLVRGLLPVPDVLEVRCADPVAGTPPLLVTEYVDGVRGDLLLADLGGDDLEAVGRAFGAVARTLSRMPMLWSGTFADAELRIEPHDVWLPDWVELHAPALGWPEDDLEALRQVAADAAPLLGSPSRVCLVHSDLNPKNLLLDPDTLQVTAVLDWEFAHAGHPATDLGNLVRFDRDPRYLDGVLSGFLAEESTSRGAALDAARTADLVALIELAARRDANPIAARAHEHLRAIARSGDVHALPAAESV